MFLFLLFSSVYAQPSPLLKNTVIAVIDTGLDQQHPALRDAVWKNSGETGLDSQGRRKETNGVDDDKNGYVDDVSGWNFAMNNNDINDQHGHGTHIAGLLAGNSAHFKGHAVGAKLMILKYYDSSAPISGNLMNSVRAIKYAILMGAHIINYSGGGLEPFGPEKMALQEALRAQIPVVAAAGNESTNADALGFYPASYGLANIVSVAALNSRGRRVPSSNWGPHGVHVAAPGENILSTFPGGRMAEMTGTSQATALVTALLAQIREQSPQQNYTEWLRKLKISSQFNKSLLGQIQVPAEISFDRALKMQDSDQEDEKAFLSKPIR